MQEILSYGRINGFPLIKDDSANFLVDIVKQCKPQKVLEIGTAIGYSGSLILNACDSATLITLEKNCDSAKIAIENFNKLNLNNRVKVLNIDAGEYLDNCNEKFDFIFLDGPKGQYVHYLEKLIKLLNINGVLLADNVLFRGYVKADEYPKKFKTIVVNLREYLYRIQNDDRLITTVYEIGDGLSVSKKVKD